MKNTAITVAALTLALSGCASNLAGSGPSADAILSPASSIKVLDLTPELARTTSTQHAAGQSLAAEFNSPAPALPVNPGDQVEIALWEAPPAVLFSTFAPGAGQSISLPAQTVSADGKITVPFVGRVQAAGKTTNEIERAILAALAGKAHKPQALVRVAKNTSADVTVVGEVASSVRMPITPRGERLLDAIAAAGGTKAPVDKVTVQLARGDKHRATPLEAIVRNPADNVRLVPGDVITVYHQPHAFTAMGAVARPGEVAFEATGITLAQALARTGGAIDNRADTQGVFLFREGETPVVYRVNLQDPASFVAMRDFPMQDRDILYVANAPIAEFQKFMSVVASVVYPVASVRNLVQE